MGTDADKLPAHRTRACGTRAPGRAAGGRQHAGLRGTRNGDVGRGVIRDVGVAVSIETTGPEKYDFQDLACVAIMLRSAGPQMRAFLRGAVGGRGRRAPPNGRRTAVADRNSSQGIRFRRDAGHRRGVSGAHAAARGRAHIAGTSAGGQRPIRGAFHVGPVPRRLYGVRKERRLGRWRASPKNK